MLADRAHLHLHQSSNVLACPHAPLQGSLQRRLKHHALLIQQQQSSSLKAQQRTTAQVAAIPAFTDDEAPSGVGAALAPPPTTQQQQQQQQQHSWLPAWGSKQPLQLHDTVAAALNQQQQQQQHQLQQAQQLQREQKVPTDPVLAQLQQCRSIQHVAAIVSSQQEQLTMPHVTAMLQQLCTIVTQPDVLPLRQQQLLQQSLTRLAQSALLELPQLGHTQVGHLLARLQQLGFRPAGSWVRAVLQHAGTELVHYTPAELALLLLTATQTAARHGALPGPDVPVVELLPSRRTPSAGSSSSSTDASSMVASPAAAAQAAAAAGATSSSSNPAGLQQQQQQQQERRANTVLTSAWLQHFLATFQPYIACRSAHPQLTPAHMEAVITCLAALRAAPDRFWLYLFVRQMSAQLPQCSPASVVRMLSALATFSYRLPDHVLLQVERQIGTAAAMAQLRAEECVDVVRSVAVLRAQQSKPSEVWLQQLLATGLRGNVHLSASAVIGLLAATAALGMQLEPSWIDVLLLQARSALSAMSPHEHVGLMDALSQQQQPQYRPGPVFMSVFMAQIASHMPALTLSQQAALAVGLATVGYKPSAAWLSAYMGKLLAQPVTGADGDDLLQLLRALRRMQYVPTPPVAQQLSGLIDSIQLTVPYQQLLLLREALDKLQYQRGIMAVPRRPAEVTIKGPQNTVADDVMGANVAAAMASVEPVAALQSGWAADVGGGSGDEVGSVAEDVGGDVSAVGSAVVEVAAVPGVPQADASVRAA